MELVEARVLEVDTTCLEESFPSGSNVALMRHLLLLLDHGLPFQEEPAPEQEMSKQEIKKSRSRTRNLMGPKVPASALHKKYGDDEQEEKEEGDDAGGDGHEVLHLHLHHGGALAQGLDDQGVVGSGRACPVLRRAHVRPVLGQGGVHDQQLAPAQRERWSND